MKIRKVIGHLIPSIRARDSIQDSIKGLSIKLDYIEKRIKELDYKNEYINYCIYHINNESELDTKKRFFRNMPKSYGGVRKIQLCSNYILRKLKEICDENSLEFALYGGTLLGAVRHNGFIPWDDDIDIIMFRNDLIKLEKILESDSEIRLKRCYRYLGEDHIAGYVWKVKFIDSPTFFVDIFSRDYVDGPREDNELDKIWQNTISLSNDYHKELKEIFIQHGFTDYNNSIPKEYPEMDNDVRELERKYFLKYDNAFNVKKNNEYFCAGIEMEDCFRWRHRIRRSNDFLPFERNAVIFEDINYDAYGNYEKWLEIQYGDIWKLPYSISPVHQNEFSSFTENDMKIIRMVEDLQ